MQAHLNTQPLSTRLDSISDEEEEFDGEKINTEAVNEAQEEAIVWKGLAKTQTTQKLGLRRWNDEPFM